MKFIIPTIVICTHNVDDFVLNSLEEIKTHSPESEIIVVDSNSPKKRLSIIDRAHTSNTEFNDEYILLYM
jgi:glycosyltransferase involved in cell wall biosynthesis